MGRDWSQAVHCRVPQEEFQMSHVTGRGRGNNRIPYIAFSFFDVCPSIRLLTSSASVVFCQSLQSNAVSLSICMTWVVPRRSHSFHAVQLECVCSWLWVCCPSLLFVFCVKATKFLPQPLPHHRPSMFTHSAPAHLSSRCLHLLSLSPHGTLHEQP
jgi:hypothetical protein